MCTEKQLTVIIGKQPAPVKVEKNNKIRVLFLK